MGRYCRRRYCRIRTISGDNLILTTELKRKLATVKSKKADVWSVSPSPERFRRAKFPQMSNVCLGHCVFTVVLLQWKPFRSCILESEHSSMGISSAINLTRREAYYEDYQKIRSFISASLNPQLLTVTNIYFSLGHLPWIIHEGHENKG